jgi:hypothetical protein
MWDIHWTFGCRPKQVEKWPSIPSKIMKQFEANTKGSKVRSAWWRPSYNKSLAACSFGWRLVLICSERKVLLAGCWWLVCCERKLLLAGITHIAARTWLNCVSCLSPLSFRSRWDQNHLPRVSPLACCQSKTPRPIDYHLALLSAQKQFREKWTEPILLKWQLYIF